MSVRLLLCVCLFITLVVHGGLYAQEDGVYELSPGNGQAIPLKIINGSIYSLDNDNDQFQVYVCFVPVGRPVGTQYYFVLDGKRMPPSYKGMTGSNDTLDLFNLTPREAASASALLGLPLQLRKNPGHRIEATFVTDKPLYSAGEQINVTVTIRNLGDEPIYYECSHYGPKDDTFSFAPVNIPAGNAKVTKQYFTPSRISYIETLPAHGEIRNKATLNEWFVTDIPGRYHFIGSYVLPMSNKEDWSGPFPIWVDYAKGPFSFDVKISITTMTIIFISPFVLFLVIFLVWIRIPFRREVIPSELNEQNYYGIAASLATVVSLSWSAHLAYIAQPISAMLWMIPILVIRPFAFGFKIYGWRRWARKFDPAFFTMIFLNCSLGLGMGTGSVIWDQIARIIFGIMAGISLLLTIYIDVYQWKRRDEVIAHIRRVIDACHNTMIWSLFRSSYIRIMGFLEMRGHAFIMIVLAGAAFTCCLFPSFYGIIYATPSGAFAKLTPALCVLVVAAGIIIAAYRRNFSTAILGFLVLSTMLGTMSMPIWFGHHYNQGSMLWHTWYEFYHLH